MRNQALVVVGAALLTAAVIVVVAFVAFNTGTKHPAGPAAGRPTASTSTSTNTGAPAGSPAPTVTVTKHQAAPSGNVAPPRPQYGGDDEEFLAMIAADGIKAPDDWAIQAGRKTCGESYGDAYRYLTDGGIYGYHVQTFLDDWTAAHGGGC
jgi:hypothetical protein